MKSATQRTLSGPFLTRDLGGGLWQLTAGASGALQIYLRIPAAAGAGILTQGDVRRLEVEWRADGVIVRVDGTGGAGMLEASSAIIHEADERLYDTLPLAAFDARARRFWSRVFLLVRLPGGRHLLRWMARRRH